MPEELIKPYVIDKDSIMEDAQNVMIPSESSSASIADELEIPEKKKDKVNDKEEAIVKDKPEPKANITSKLLKPYEFLQEGLQDPNHKLYLVLLVYDNDDTEDVKDFKFIRGRQKVFDTLVSEFENPTMSGSLDAMRSLIYVESKKHTIATRTSLYKFMKDVLVTNKVINDTGFDINEYYYDYEYEERTEIGDGEEE